MKILITGGSGFIASHVVGSLLISGHQIRILELIPNPFGQEIEDVEYFYGSIQDQELVGKALDGMDVVCHFVSTTVPSTSNLNPVYDIESNLISTINILDMMRKKKMERIVYLSSGGTVYGKPQSYPINEMHSELPICSYGVVKLAVEKYLLMYQVLYGIKPLIIRPSNVYGVRQNYNNKQGVIAHFLYSSLNNQPITLWGDGSIRRDYLYVTDIADLILTGINKNIIGVYNAGAGTDNSLLDIIEVIEEVSGLELIVRNLPERNFDVPKVMLDITKTKETFKWQPKVSLIEGITKQFNWMKEEIIHNI